MCYSITTQIAKKNVLSQIEPRRSIFINLCVKWCLVLQGISVIFNVALALLKVRTHTYTHAHTLQQHFHHIKNELIQIQLNCGKATCDSSNSTSFVFWHSILCTVCVSRDPRPPTLTWYPPLPSATTTNPHHLSPTDIKRRSDPGWFRGCPQVLPRARPQAVPLRGERQEADGAGL